MLSIVTLLFSKFRFLNFHNSQVFGFAIFGCFEFSSDKPNQSLLLIKSYSIIGSFLSTVFHFVFHPFPAHNFVILNNLTILEFISSTSDIEQEILNHQYLNARIFHKFYTTTSIFTFNEVACFSSTFYFINQKCEWNN